MTNDVQYTISPSDSRRDPSLDTNTPFTLGQAFGHISSYHRPGQPDAPYRLSPSPSPVHPHHSHVPQQQQHASAPNSSSFTGSTTSPQLTLKRKPTDAPVSASDSKRRREDDVQAPHVPDFMEVGVGAKHWSDEEKTRLFSWLMGPGQDEHWNALRATKNSCLRDCSIQVFGNKKTYQALKGCYERNFNLFKQIYALEAWCHRTGNAAPMDGLSETERLKEYERRLNSARKLGCDVGSIIPRTVDNWHQLGWYRLFYTRWHGDPATTKPVQHRQSMAPPSGGDSHDVDLDDNGMDYNDPNLQALANSHEPISFVHAPPAPPPPPPPQIRHNHSQPPHQPLPPQVHSLTPSHSHSAPPHSQAPPSLAQLPPPPPPPPPMHHTMPVSPGFAPAPFSPEGHGLMMPPHTVNALMQYLQTKTQTAKSKLDYLRRREEREERDSLRRQETERIDLDRKKAELDFNIQVAQQKEKTDRAIEILQNQNIDPSIKAAAGEYLKKMFSND